MTKTKFKTSLIAPCGINCGTCSAYLRVKDKCPGCRERTNMKVSVSRCRIKNCVVFSEGKIKYCSSCESFACRRLRELDKRYRTKYNMSLIDNLNSIRETGIREFIRTEKIKWSCSKCGGTICVHRGHCLQCGV